LPENIRNIVASRAEYNPSSAGYDPSVVGLDSSDWQIASFVNGFGAELDGMEISYMHDLSMLLDGFGLYANYTHVESEAKEGLSENSYNAGIYYEKDNFGGRIVVNGRDDYVTSQVGGTGNLTEGATGPTRVDMSAYWNISENLTLTFDAINLTNETERLYSTGPLGDFDLVREYNATGTEIVFGIRGSF